MQRMDLPTGWQIRQISDVLAEAQAGFACGERDENGAIQLRMNNVGTTGNFDWNDFIRVPVDDGLLSRFKLENGDVVFNNTNSTELVGKSALFAGYLEPVVYSNHFTRLRLKSDLCDPLFFSYWLNHLWHQKIFENICNRWIGQSAVQIEKLSGLEIILPSLPEQQRIAQLLKIKLAAVERARQASEVRLAAARELSAAYLREAFESEEALSWPQKPIGDLVTSSIRTGISKPEDPSSNIYCLTLSAVRNGSLRLDELKPVSLTPPQLAENRLRPGAFYVVRGNGNRSLVGRGGLAPSDSNEIVFPDLLFEIIPDQQVISPDFLRWAWDSRAVRNQIEEKSMTAAGIYKINQRNLASITVPTPPINVQQKVSVMLSERAKQLRELERLIADELAGFLTYPASLLRQAFSGAM